MLLLYDMTWLLRQVAARTLGDIVRKLGEKVLPEIIPILERGLESSESDQRQGVCIGLSEIMSSTSRDHVSTRIRGLPLMTTGQVADHYCHWFLELSFRRISDSTTVVPHINRVCGIFCGLDTR